MTNRTVIWCERQVNSEGGQPDANEITLDTPFIGYIYHSLSGPATSICRRTRNLLQPRSAFVADRLQLPSIEIPSGRTSSKFVDDAVSLSTNNLGNEDLTDEE